MLKGRLKLIITLGILVIFVGTSYGVSKLLVSNIPVKVSNGSETSKVQEYVTTPDGVKIKNQIGSMEYRSVVCVENFFTNCLPDIDLGNEFTVTELSDTQYAIDIGDWRIFTNSSSNISYPERFFKKYFSDKDKEYILSKFPKSTFVESEEVYEWVLE